LSKGCRCGLRTRKCSREIELAFGRAGAQRLNLFRGSVMRDLILQIAGRLRGVLRHPQ
jgi:hypothetical protein